MLTKLEVFNPRIPESPLALDAGSASSDAFQIKDIDGLGPVSADITTTPYAGDVDGEALAGASVGKRNIVITLSLNANWVTHRPADLRGLIYRYFMPKANVRLRFHSTHLPLAEVSGVVESTEPAIFAKEPEVQISVLCTESHFKAVQEEVVVGSVVASPAVATDTILYQGTAPVGYQLKILGGSTAYNNDLEVAIYNPLEEVFAIKGQVAADKQIHISTVDRNKYARQYTPSTGISTSLLGAVAPNTTWQKLWPGENGIVVRRLAAGTDLTWELRYYALFGGL